jgi:hypothetical protein
LDNFEDMYDNVYEKLRKSGIAENLDEAVWRDKDNNIFGTQAEAYGRKMQYSLLHPEYLVMVDEVGEHISQKGDWNAGGQKFMVRTTCGRRSGINLRITISRSLVSLQQMDKQTCVQSSLQHLN